MTALSVTAIGAAGISLISLATHRRWAQVGVAGGAWLVSGAVYQGLRPASTSEDWANTTVISVLSLGSSSPPAPSSGPAATFWPLRERVATAEREQAGRVAQARATERARIAREMHDVLAHRLSLVAMQSGALAYRSDRPARRPHRPQR